MSNLVPEGWSYDQLGDYISESVAGEWGVEATGDTNDIPVLRSTNFTASGIIDYSKLAYRNIDERKRLAKSLKFGDIVLEKSGGSPTQPVGRVVYFDKYKPFLFSNFTQKLSPVDTCDSKFLFYKLYSEYQNGTVLKFQQQTTGIINFQLAEYLGYKSAFPPLPEQQKIATILSSIDNVIEKTRAQIDKLKDLKTGMMQELLTKGIGHTEFKDSPVGLVPMQWEIVKFEDVFSDYKYGPRFSSKDYSSCGNVKTIRGTDLSSDGEVHYNQVPTASIDPKTVESHRLRDGDLVMITTAECGSSAVFREQKMPYIASAYAIKLSPTDRVFPEFIKYFMQTPNAMVQIESFIRKGTVANLPGSDVMNIVLALPAYLEQRKIASMLLALDAKISRISQKLAHVKLIKKALMQDLLTGKVRVNLTDKESAVV